MKPRMVYAGLAIAGTILPYWQFSRFLRQDGLNFRALVQQLFANGASGFFTMDVLVSSLVVIALLRIEGGRSRIAHRWAPVLALLTVGVSLALPLYLYLREAALEAAPRQRAS